MVNIKLERVLRNDMSYQDKLKSEGQTDLFSTLAPEHWGGIETKETEGLQHITLDLFNDFGSYSKYIKGISSSFNLDTVKNLMDISNFKFKKGQFITIGNNVIVGTKGVKGPEDWRQLGYDMVKYIRRTFPKVSFALINRLVNKNSKQFFEGLYLAEYKFDKYKTNKKSVKDLVVLVSGDLGEDKSRSRTEIFNAIKEAKNKVKAQFMVRDWVNTTPEDANSETISGDIEARFEKSGKVDVRVYGEDDLERLNMRGHLTVNRASKFEPKVVRITYTPRDFKQGEDSKIVVGVGKGLTYDSGGLSIKPSNSMTTMKADKSGAMVLYGLADVLAKRGGKNKVVLYLAFAENMISPDSYRPDDVVKFKNGKTAHIKNTDAEGRVVLFDSLCLAQEENPDLDEIFSIATLTGAAVYQFGDEAAGMVSKNEELFGKFYEKGKMEDEIFCEAKLHKFMLDGIKDDVADFSNTGTTNQGCQKAGLFLMRAIEKKHMKKYIHLDIAGPSFVTKAFGTNPANATGFGVRTLFEVYR